jgi:hypothetical protein
VADAGDRGNGGRSSSERVHCQLQEWDTRSEELQAVGDQYLSLVLEHNVIVWYSPCCGVILESLQGLAESWAMVLACLLC